MVTPVFRFNLPGGGRLAKVSGTKPNREVTKLDFPRSAAVELLVRE
jgi:hypothetical protein